MVLSALCAGAESFVGDNSQYFDDNTAQRLKTEDIHQLREQGASGHDIIRSLIQNSDTWENKSQFAREKWLARKQKRYVRRVRIVKCTPDILADVYHLKSKDKIWYVVHPSVSLLRLVCRAFV